MTKSISIKNLKRTATDAMQYAIALRRALHQIPELGFEEVQTIAFLTKEIQKWISTSNRNITFHEYKGGLVVNIDIDKHAKRLLFRADIDGLAIEENTNLPYASKHKGKMHACGHDMHASMLLAAFKEIATSKESITKNLRFVWQRSEERKVDGISGGEMLIKEGILNEVDEVYALHVLPTLKTGVFCSNLNYLMANTHQFHFSVECKGGHVMNPHIGSNAIDVLTDMQAAAKGFVSRFLSPNEQGLLVPSILKSGNASNVRPCSGSCAFSFRTYISPKRFSEFKLAFYEKLNNVVSCYKDAKISIYTHKEGYPILKNSSECVYNLKLLLESNDEEYRQIEKFFAGEDFAYFLKQKKGAFVWLGAGGVNSFDLHTPKFNPDENAMSKGIFFWLLLAF